MIGVCDMAIGKVSIGVVMALVAIALFLTVTTAGLLSVNQTVPSTGIVTTVNVGVYSDSACTQNLTNIAWGNISPGNSTTRTIYVKNTGSNRITLAMTKDNWNPATANGPIVLNWNREATQLSPGQSTTAILTLTVLPTITGITNFSFNIIITGTG